MLEASRENVNRAVGILWIFFSDVSDQILYIDETISIVGRWSTGNVVISQSE